MGNCVAILFYLPVKDHFDEDQNGTDQSEFRLRLPRYLDSEVVRVEY